MAPGLCRRLVLAGGVAGLATPLLGQGGDPWAPVAAMAQALPQCHALAIRQNGADALVQVFRGPPLGRAVPVKSVSKTLVAALVGAALARGELPSLQARLGDLVPDLIPPRADPRVAGITVENLVTMQTGLERTSGANYGAWVASADWVADALARPFVAEPGGPMLYATGSYHVLGAVLSRLAGQTLLDLARARLGQPLGIDIPAWTRDPQGRYLGGNEMALTLEAMVRFGELYRRGGQVDSQQVLPRDWVAASLVARTQSQFSGLDYGYGWFLGSAGGARFALARGYGGQVICIVPDLGLTLALTSDPALPARSGGYFGAIMQVIAQGVIPVARGQLG